MRIFQIVAIVATLIAYSHQTPQNNPFWLLLQGRNNNGNVNNFSTADQQLVQQSQKQPVLQQTVNVPDTRPRQQQQFSVVLPEANNLAVSPTVSSDEIVMVPTNVSNQTRTESVTPTLKNNNIPGRQTGLLNFGAEMNAIITAGVALLGAALGRQGCDLKAACLAGTFIPEIQGREMVVLVAEALVPPEWKEAYNAAKVSIVQRQDCSRFSCF